MITTDTGAKKIEGTDNWRQIFGAHNDSVDAYDANVAALQDALGIVVDGNKSAVAASTGQFIILKNSSIVDSGTTMLADGLYTAAKAIPANTVIDKTYLTADANGGLNALNSKIEKIVDYGTTLWSTSTTSTTSKTFVQPAYVFAWQNQNAINSNHMITVTRNNTTVLDLFLSAVATTIPVSAGDTVTIKGDGSYASMVRAYSAKS